MAADRDLLKQRIQCNNCQKIWKNPHNQEFQNRVTEDQTLMRRPQQQPDWLQKPTRHSLLSIVNGTKTLPNAYGLVQPWISSLA
ncbi:hypothetical protein Tco_0936597 [Tanacetum coccineum]|uniref:Uncharacterized protein n=1 Tax=Tanacetum coccineum TaxID=301880 RepID=A0ABQ5DCS4_9ASTR